MRNRGNPLIRSMSENARKHPSLNGHPVGYAGQDGWQTDPEQLEAMYRGPSAGPVETGRATINDVVVKTLSLLGIILVGGVIGWTVPALGLLGILVAFVLAMVVIFSRKTRPALIVSYAVFEGLGLGGFSSLMSGTAGGSVAAAVVATLVVFFGMLALYAKANVRLSGRVMGILLICMVAYAVFCLVNFAFAMYTGTDMREFTIPGTAIPWGVPLGLIAVGMAALCLLSDFQEIDGALKAGVPQRESWKLAFGLVLTLVWLYVELLRLISYATRD